MSVPSSRTELTTAETKRKRRSGTNPRKSHSPSVGIETTGVNKSQHDKESTLNVMVNQCHNCHTCASPAWRLGEEFELLCNKCGLYQKRYGHQRPLLLPKRSVKNKKRNSSSTSDQPQEIYSVERKKKKLHAENDTLSTLYTVSSKESSSSLDLRNQSKDSLQNFTTSEIGVQQDISQAAMSRPECNNRESPTLFEILQTDSFQHAVNEDIFQLDYDQSCSSMELLRNQLHKASSEYPELIETMISIIRKHVLSQKHVIELLLSKQDEKHLSKALNSTFSIL
ncbi:hypothetical protein C9374_012675 [Naegleria lovaniensis]|uniref:GATA-type domain-containing protein n=1 Tax=Naegleria lovaniensis TaxID=51637 RepID=A0AA88KNS5_NAELO|nr:uncharacterized protein C9374_012675 [Naegleria lovaniensis]KAG2392423.1 hypothetical protein C9374_012675 [Naegleria lovaniensis]